MKSRLTEILKSGRAPGMNLRTPDPTNVDVAAPRGLRDMEQQWGTSQLERKLGMRASKLKRIWGISCLLLLATVAATAGQLSRGRTLVDGSTLFASDLHALVENSTITASFYTDQSQVTALSSGYVFLIYDAGSGRYRRINAQNVLYSNTNYFLLQPSLASVPSYARVVLYNPSNNTMYAASASSLVSGAVTNISIAGIQFGDGTNYNVPEWPYGFSAFQTTNAPSVLALGTNSTTAQYATWSSVAPFLAADLGTNLSLAYTFNQVFQPWTVYPTNATTNVWGVNTNFTITNLTMFSQTNYATLTNADTLPIYSGLQGSNTVVTLGALAQFFSAQSSPYYIGSNSLPAVAKTNVYAHGLGVVPRTVNVELVCTNADSVGGYAVGDFVNINGVFGDAGYSSFNTWYDTTNVYVFRSGNSGLWVLKRGTGANADINANPTRYNLRVYARP